MCSLVMSSYPCDLTVMSYLLINSANNFHCTVIPVVVLDSVITHTSAWFLDREIHQLVKPGACQPLTRA